MLLAAKPERCEECGRKILEVDGRVDTPVRRLPRLVYTCPNCFAKFEVKLP